MLSPWKKAMTNFYSILKSRYITLSTKFHLVSAMVFLVVMCGCERWTRKKSECQRIDAFKWWFWRRIFSKSLGLQGETVNPKRNQAWIFIGSTGTETEAPILGHLMQRSNSLEKTLYAGEDWRQEEKGMAEDEIVGWHYQLNEHEFEQTLGNDEGQGSLACRSL